MLTDMTAGSAAAGTDKELDKDDDTLAEEEEEEDDSVLFFFLPSGVEITERRGSRRFSD